MNVTDLLHEVPVAAIEAWSEAIKFWGQWHKFFLKGFKIAADGVYEDWMILTKARDRKEVFDKVQDAAYGVFVKNGSMKDTTFARYCKIARYCLIYRVPWEIGAEANRAQLRWCKEKAKQYKGGTQEERMGRAWEEMPPELGKKIKSPNDGEDAKGTGFAKWADPDDFDNDDDFLLDATKMFIYFIQKDHADRLIGESNIKVALRRFFGDVSPLIKPCKKKVVNTKVTRE